MEVADKWQNRRNRRNSASYKTSGVADDANFSNEGNHSYTTRVDNK
ncbi:General stress protein-like protein [Staphylococcus gallinarum]|nr:General stress protein-like protein [Staphylococcus gallinarum]